ncbi:hypothetical protein I5Q41_17105 [Pseudomonas monteilii]|uniref:hypothetical protein n=1 Tax=Pseudomonas TaxID=286 RepID=UPI00041002B1|nr:MULTISPECIES: hypothetical protein [Pseudomonas]MBH3396718.1 hypothetical protein [Pseudomonas monteilii]MBH3456402.1 hypothetical protein [Pseudomonas monteilii]PXX61958.1 hypothetical protein D906_04285 [Pseudomonas sp. LAIL14HWK12:I1]SMD17298.1 hypothetical protein SAMN05660385_05178 [Pseudomonas sp. URIL14HWK12:I5]SNB84914.1 hypothetical protein SAMN02745900_04534 [Pseudomonas sp. URIL14HWK12:I8]
MNPSLPILALGLALCLSAHAAPQPLQLAAGNNNPYNSPIQRANPNSRQGSMPVTPPVRGPSTEPYQRTPSLDNRGIGNGDNLRRQQQTPNLEPTRPPRDSTRAP